MSDTRLPVKLDAATNGEYFPKPLDPRLVHIKKEALAHADRQARRLGVSRRAFLGTSAGTATVLLGLNQIGCGGGRYAVPPEAADDPEAGDVLVKKPGDFIFDVQTHHVASDRPWWKASVPTLAEFLTTTPQAKCGAPHWSECFARDAFLKEVFMDSDTDLAVLSALWGTDDINAIQVQEMALTRQRLAQMEGAPRLLIHGIVLPKSEGQVKSQERMAALVNEWKIAAWKLYPVYSTDGAGWRMDDPKTGLWTLQQGVALGVKTFAVHKGLPLPGRDKAFTSPVDIGPAAKAVPEATILVYHSGYHPDRREGPYDPTATLGVDALIRSCKESGIGKDGNVYAEMGSVWRELMKDPDQAAHYLGKLLVHLGEDRIIWGTDAIWYGSPQDQIQALRTFEISPEFQERYGYPAITPAIKAKIFGLNAARVYGIDKAEIDKAQRWDPVARAREDYRNDPRPTHQTYGPKTRREMLAFLDWER